MIALLVRLAAGALPREGTPPPQAVPPAAGGGHGAIEVATRSVPDALLQPRARPFVVDGRGSFGLGPSAPAPSAGPALQPRSVAGARTRRIPSRQHAALCAPAERNRSRTQCSSRRDAKYQQLLAHAEERVFESVNEAVEAILAGLRRVGRVPPEPGRCARARVRAGSAHTYIQEKPSAAQSLDRSP